MNAVDLLIGGALGYTLLNFKVEETTDDPRNITTGFLGTTKKSVYKNPGVTGRVGAGLVFNIGRFTLGGEVGTALDFSNPGWRLDGQLINAGPDTYLSGFYGAAHVGLNFEI